MKALVLNGFDEDSGVPETILKAVQLELSNAGAETKTLDLRDLRIGYCVGCFGCWTKTPGICVIDDDARDIAENIVNSDVVVYLTPVTFGGYSSLLKEALDRTACVLLSPFFTKIDGEIHHKKRYYKYHHIVAVGLLPEMNEECERIFKTVVSRNAINLYSPGYSAGVVIKSAGPEQIREKVQTLLTEAGVKI